MNPDLEPETENEINLDPQLIPWLLLLERTLDLLYELEGGLENAVLLSGANPLWTRVAYRLSAGMETNGHTLANLPDSALAIAPFLPRIVKIRAALFELL